MNHVYRQAKVPYSAQQMYDLVNDINAYPQFLPWCKSAHICEQTAEHIIATLVLAKGGIHKAFTTCNRLTPAERIDIELVDGPFKHLTGHWRFQDQPDGGCFVSVDMEFEFSSRILGLLLEPIFNEITQTLVTAFTKRAETVL